MLLVVRLKKRLTKESKVEKRKVIEYFPDKVDFAGEQAPLLKIEDVKERFDRELIVNKIIILILF
jgi:hypothetical protein